MKQQDAFKILKQGHNVLLTGAAGSGKTYLLEKFSSWAKENKINIALTATTGIAATNINGRTIHNYSNLGISSRENLVDDEYVKKLAIKMRAPYKNTIKNTSVLVIDEISMLHDYQLNAIDKIIRIVRNNTESFGGLQVVLCGDFFQLPPIVKNNDSANFITESVSYNDGNFKVCYLEEFWRQDKDDELISILNAIRSNNLTDEYSTLKNKCIPYKDQSQNTTRLYCTNKNIDAENKQKLNSLKTEVKTYLWKESGNKNELSKLKKDCGNKIVENLELKVGAVIMFTKNNIRLGYYNGSIGEVVSFDEDNYPNIKLNNGKILNSIKYDDFYREDLNGKRTATINQIPLKLAWAITIHKSQGMTLDKVAIDLSNTFTPGQGYVALSRARSINDISLLGIEPKSLDVSLAALHIEHKLQKKSKESQNILKAGTPDISKKVFPLKNINEITIIKVETVAGSCFPPNKWRRDMQKIETNIGGFIDNITQYNGFNWKSKEGMVVTGFTINESCGYKWLNKNT